VRYVEKENVDDVHHLHAKRNWDLGEEFFASLGKKKKTRFSLPTKTKPFRPDSLPKRIKEETAF